MPARPQWLTRLPQIVAELVGMNAPIVDRTVIERVFQVRRRRAAQLMQAFGGYQVGRTYVVDRIQLIDRLEETAQADMFLFEVGRRERLNEILEKTRHNRRAAAIVIPVSTIAATPDLLPAGILLSPGVLKIEFERPIELLEKLYQLAQMITANFDWFEASAGR
jgi:hypothetical protein